MKRYALVLLLAGCTGMHSGAMQTAVTELKPTKGNKVSGTVSFQETSDGVIVTARVTGLKPGSHGFHIHEKGDCSAADGTSAGGHFNPGGTAHALPSTAARHEGDLGNIEADSKGVAVLSWKDPDLTFEGPGSIIGRSIIVHAAKDDGVTQPTGNAGARVACGVIEQTPATASQAG